MSRSLAAALLGAALGLAPCAAAAQVPPPPSRWVTDGAGFLSEGTRQALDARLEAYERRTGHQVLVWIGRSAGGVPIEDFAVRAFAAWRVGRKGLDDGLVLFVFAEDRQLRVEVGYGLEGRVPDAIASRVIREVIVPGIQAGDRDGAVSAGVDALLGAIEGRAVAPEAGPRTGPSRERPPPGRPLTAGQKALAGLLVLAFLVLLVTNPSLALYLLFSMFSGGRGGGGGGGGWSGGGGRSGGGGASGSW